MRTPRLLFFLLLLLTIVNSSVFSQNRTLKTILSIDSLAGFDEAGYKSIAVSKGLYGDEFLTYMYQQQRLYINQKYHFRFRDYETDYVANYHVRYSGGTTNNAPCVNEDFEANSFTGWSIGQGTNGAVYNGTLMTACVDNPCPTPISTGSLASIVSTPYSDPLLNISIPNSPFGGTKVARLNTEVITSPAQFRVTKITQNFPVTANNSLFDFAYFAVMDATSPHLCCEQPYMYVKMRDCFGNLLSTCPVFSITVPGTGCSGTGPTSWTYSLGIARSNGWQQYSIDLASYIGCNVTMEVTVGHCQYGGHFAYAYFDSRCNQMNFTVNSSTVNAPSPSAVTATVPCASTATLTAPSGLGPYSWTGPAGSGISSNTNQIITTATPGSYSISMNPVGICNPINRVISLSFPPPTTLTASPASLCAGSSTSSTLTATGASSYTWAPGGSTATAIVVSPTITTVYTLTAKTGTCIGTFTIQVTVNPQPGVTAVSSNTSVCPGQSAQLTAFNANTYQWFPGGLTSNPITVSPTSPTTYTVTGTAATGCTNTATVSIGIDNPPTVIIFPISPTLVCSGGTVSMIAAGANTVTWYPGGTVTPNPTFTVFSSTTFTAIGASGTCTNSATISISVDPGPSMTITPSPTIVCPGGTTTLSVVSPGAVGSFTWNPGAITGTSIAITTSLSGGYSVTAKNSLGCSNTQTANPNISPLPSLTITPSSPTVCFGNSVSVTASGATNYTWMPGNLNGTSVSLSPTINTTYTVTGANAAGCTSQTTVLVSVINQPTLTASASPPSFCSGNCFTMTTTGVSTFTVVPASLCPTINTTYSVTGTGANGCPSNSVTVTVTVNTGPSMTVTASPATVCAGSSSTLSATGATSYTWSTGAFTPSIIVTPSSTAVYTVTGVNGFGCTTIKTVTVNVVPVPTITIAPPSPSICAGSNVTLTANGGTSYTWSPGGSNLTSIVVNPTVNSTYTLVGSNGACTGQTSVLVSVVPIPTITANYSPSSVCAGSCATLVTSGAATYTITGGLSAIACPVTSTNYTVTGSSGGCISNSIVGTLTVNPGPPILASANPTNICPGDSSLVTATGALTYTWQPGGATGASFYAKPLVTTVYTVSGSNGGCPGIQTVVVNVTPAPSISVTASPTAICAGGSVTLTATGSGNYFWTPGSLSGSPVFVTPTITTTYTVTGNSGACTGSANVTVVVNPIPTVNINPSTLIVCAGSPVTMTATGASNYTWSTGSNATVITVTPLSNTTYSLRGSNAGCLSNVASVNVTVNAIPSFTLSKNPASICPGGSATLTATGATSYTWLPVSLTGSSIVVSPGSSTTYTVTGSNGASCTSTQTINLPVNPAVTVSASASPSNACSGNPVILSATGANNYTWSPGNLTGANVTITASVSTIFTVVGTNSFGCSGQATTALNVSPSPTVTINPSSVGLCPGSCATLVANGASTYTWSTGSNSPSIVVCPTVAAVYNFSVIGSSGGCSGMGVASVTVSNPPTISASANPQAVCPGGASTLSATGGSSYTWQPGNLTGSSVVVNPTISTVYTVMGSNGACTNTAAVQVTVSPVPVLVASASPTAVCPGQSSTLNVTGGSSYTWSPGGLTGSSIIVTPSLSTAFTVSSNVSGCTGNAVVVVIVNPAAIISATATPANLCSGIVATLSASGGTSYVWQPGSGTGNPYLVIPVVSTVYTVTGTNAAGCTGTATAAVNVSSPPTLSISATNNSICAGGSATLSGSGASSYTWNPGGSPFPGIVVTPSITTVYTLTGSNGTCTSSATYTVFVLNGSPLAVNASSNTTCSGFTVALTASGSASSYTWMPGSLVGNPVVVTPTITTTYTVTGSNGSCSSSATITINILQLPNVNVTANPSVLCQSGTTTLTATGANTYSWLPSLAGGATFVDSPTTTTTYTVVGFDNNGCPNFDTTTVNVLQPPNISIVATPTAVCSGSTGTLTATGATSYTWNTGGSGSTTTVSPVTPTTYTVLGSNGACIGMATILVGVNPLPFVSATGTPIALCSGETVTLTGGGATNYTWSPTGLTGSTITDNPLTTTAYTVTGADANGCKGRAVIIINVTPGPTLSAIATPTAVCAGNPITLNANGANTYTWNPGGQLGSSITETPAITTVYTVTGTDGNGCKGTATVNAIIIPTPTLNVSPLNASLCLGSVTTLTASGATGGYTWMPNGVVSPTLVVSPTVTTTYTLVGDNGGICFATFTVSVIVLPLPANVNATSTGTVSCTDKTAHLFGACTDTNVTYSWAGPQGYSANTQNATITGIWGIFTLTVVNNLTGCAATATVNVPTDGSIPLVNATTSGSITCSVSTVTLNAAHTTTNPGYSWVGPGAFTSTIQSPTATLPGNYTITVTDLSSTCTGTAVVTVGIHTQVAMTASIAPSSCSGGVSNNDGKITVTSFTTGDKYDIVTGTTYTGTATYANAAIIPTSGILASNLANPTTTLAYTLRLFDAQGCTKDTTVYLIPVDCSLRTLGIAKAASEPALNSDGTYNVTYTVVVKNYDTGNLTNVALTDNLVATFPAPATFTVDTIQKLSGTSLNINANFDGSTQLNLLSASANTLAPDSVEMLQFSVKVKAGIFFVSYNNTVLGTALNPANKTMLDSSNIGLDPDPDHDDNPYNNNKATPVEFKSNIFFGITKVGEIHKSDNASFDVSYTITIHNLGNDTLRNVSLNDSLFAKTVRNPATYSMRSGPTLSGSGLVTNSGYNGKTDIRLIDPTVSKMYPKTTSSISFVINVIPGTITELINSAYGNATAAKSATENVVVSDTSGAGTDPDVNHNEIWNEPADNIPTVLLIPTDNDIFIPQGFSPNSDNINDLWVIKNLPKDGENSVVIYNRWGNKVYSNPNYDNSWDGTPNAPGTLGKNKLPDGTYYFILEMKGSGHKPITGFVVIQY